ncbi:helix-turn-helix domain-containing protein [Microvirga tunisiensis]|uniref:Helix-turn-helix domain-containing protein n=2 Tax=Pannonibacter tanglangensis TaxID=2750084 RepID=A0ABW9ZD91_9HYPH|nr:helix-turn-helix domain-containing protein [Pannonibacter sp. XCT-34]
MLRLKKIRKERGMTQAQVAALIGLDLTNYNRLENGKTELTYSRMQQLAKLLHVDPVDLLTNRGGTRTVAVRAHVQAGSWSEATEWPEEDWYEVSVPDADDLRGHELYAAETRGTSMDKVYPEGTVVVFAALRDPSDMQVGRRYIVERQRADGLREATVKTLAQDAAGKFWLMPESTDPRHQAPIELNGGEEDRILILGRVVYSVRRER